MALVQQVSNDSGSATANTIAVTITGVVAGNALIVRAACANSGATPSCSDGVEPSYSAGASVADATEPFQLRTFQAFAVQSGSHTITIDWGTAVGYRLVVVEEHSGLSSREGGSALRQTTGTTRNAGSYSNTADGELLAVCVDYSWLSLPAADTGAGYTDQGAFWDFGGETTNRGRSELQAFTGSASRSATFTGVNTGSISYAVQDFYLTSQVEQEGFRFGLDDGNESGHGFSQNQDANDTAALSATRLLRVLLNATADPASAAYALRSQKNGSGGYTLVPVGSSSEPTPVMEAGDATVTTIGTAADPWAINVPNASTGDLLIFIIAWDDSVTVSTVTAPAGQNSETISSIVGPAASASTEMRIQAWRTVCTGAWTAGTISFNPSASETCRAVVVRVPAGEFDATTPIGASASAVSAGTAETNINSPAFSAGATDGNGRLVLCFGSDADAITVPASGTDTVNNATGGGVGLDIETRTAGVTDSESIASITATIASDSWACLAFIVRAPTVTNEVFVATSSNIAAGGEATTARLTAPSGKTTSDFDTGRRWDDENGTDTIDITADDYTEVEWCLSIQSPAVNGDFFDFRVYADGSPLNTYTVTPRWTIGSAFDPALMAAMNRPWRDIAFSQPKVVASGSTPSDSVPR